LDKEELVFKDITLEFSDGFILYQKKRWLYF